VSSIGKFLSAKRLRGEFWIAGDEAYVCTELLITPFPASQADEWEDSFNFYHSSLRMHVEQAFGMMVARWRILREGLEFSVERDARIICLAAKLHNFCIEQNSEPFTTVLSSSEEDTVRSEEQIWYEQCKRDEEKELRREGSAVEGARRGAESRKRRRMVRHVKERGLQRPPVVSAREGRSREGRK